MRPLHVTLFGVFTVNGEIPLKNFSSQKVQELFAYLLLNPGKNHKREKLASLLWSYQTTTQSKANLRKILWQFQQGLKAYFGSAFETIFKVDACHVKLDCSGQIILDTAVFEKVYKEVTQIPCENFLAENQALVEEAVDLYKGELLEGFYEAWCDGKRERYRKLYLILLDKLVEIAFTKKAYAQSIDYGLKILAYDCARESTHRQLMRAYYLGGDRTSALRQFHRCIEALKEEFDVSPEPETRKLYEQIQTGSYQQKTVAQIQPDASILKQMNLLQQKLSGLQQEVGQMVDSFRVQHETEHPKRVHLEKERARSAA